MVAICCFAFPRVLLASGFDESFNGDGPFESLDGKVVGLDNPDWEISADFDDDSGNQAGLEDGGYAVELNEGNSFRATAVAMRQLVENRGSFRNEIVLEDLTFYLPTDPFGSQSKIFFGTAFPTPDGNLLGATMQLFPARNPEGWWFRSSFGGGGISLEETVRVPASSTVSLSMTYDNVASQFTFSIDNGSDPQQFEMAVPDGAIVPATSFTSLEFAIFGGGRISASLDSWKFENVFIGVGGDFDGDGLLTAADLDLLTSEVRRETHDVVYDINFDGFVTPEDRVAWVKDLSNTYFGDSNFDGEFNSTDLVQVFVAAEYEDDLEQNSLWSSGDWNGDGEFNSRDLVTAFQDAGYEKGRRVQVESVPEPCGFAMLFSAVSLFGVLVRRRCPTEINRKLEPQNDRNLHAEMR